MDSSNHELGGIMMRSHIASVAAGTAAVVLATAVFADPVAKLAPADIQSTFFTGQPFTAATPSNVKYKMTFLADGKMKRVPVGAGSKGEGTWQLSKEGFCTTWNGSKPSCFTIVAARDNKWSVLKGSTMLATWSK
jgi:hypothetical protein